VHITVVSTLTPGDIIQLYYPTDSASLSELLYSIAENAVVSRTEEFTALANEYGLSINDICRYVFEKTDRFPFFIQEHEIRDILNTLETKK